MARQITWGALAVTAAAAVAGCTQFPELDAAEPQRTEPAAYPRIVPIEPLIAEDDMPRATAETEAELNARAAALRRKADALRARQP